MRRVYFFAMVVILAVVGVYLIGGQRLGLVPGPSPSPTIGAVRSNGAITAEGQVVPVRNVQLASTTGGTVSEVLVNEGEQVDASSVLVRLDSAQARSAVNQAQAGLQRAQANLTALRAGPRREDVDAAVAAVESAKAQQAKLLEGSRPEDVKAAEAALAAAQASLAKVQQGPDSDVVAAAKNDLAKLKAGPTAEEIKAATLGVEQAKNALWAAQTSRDGVCGSAGVPRFQCDAANSQVAIAQTQVEVAQNNLKQVTAGPRPEDIATAQAHLDKLMQGPTPADVANARSQVQAAQARLDALKTPVRQADLDAAQAAVQQSVAQLAVVQAPARPEAIAAAEADVASAQAALEGARVALADREIRAPFAGIVANLDVKPGAFVPPGAAIVGVADPTSWQVETTDLTELNVTRVQVGQPATLTFDAIPGLTLPARVARIKALGAKDRGDILYTVTLEPTRPDDRLRWNMTAAVNITP